MKLHKLFALFVIITAALSACDDTASSIGSSLTEQNVSITVDTFGITGHSVQVNAVRPKTSYQFLGRVNIPGFGMLSSDIVTQFLPSTKLDTATYTYENVDSLVLIMSYRSGAFIGDSVAPMGLQVYPLIKPLPDNISSDFNPAGYYGPLLASKTYNTSTLGQPASVQGASTRAIRINLGKELGQKLFKEFKENPANYASGQVFAKNLFPGLYIRNSFGSGRLTNIAATGMSMHLRKIHTPEGASKPDTLDAEHLYYLVTPEVVCNNNLSVKLESSLTDRIAAGQTLLVAPAGYDAQLTFPLQEIIARYKSIPAGLSLINKLTLSIPVDTIKNGNSVDVPPYVLLVLSNKRDEFFQKNKLPDGTTSFYAPYDATTKAYNFTGLREYLLEKIKKDNITEDDYTFSLVPVNVTFESSPSYSSSYYYGSTASSQVVAQVQPFISSPAMGVLNIPKAQVLFTYSSQAK